MKFRINLTYVYDVEPEMIPDGVIEDPRDLIATQVPDLPEIIASAIREKKKGILLSVDLVQEMDKRNA